MHTVDGINCNPHNDQTALRKRYKQRHTDTASSYSIPTIGFEKLHSIFKIWSHIVYTSRHFIQYLAILAFIYLLLKVLSEIWYHVSQISLVLLYFYQKLLVFHHAIQDIRCQPRYLHTIRLIWPIITKHDTVYLTNY